MADNGDKRTPPPGLPAALFSRPARGKPATDEFTRTARAVWTVRGLIALLLSGAISATIYVMTTVGSFETKNDAKRHEDMPEHPAGSTSRAVQAAEQKALRGEFDEFRKGYNEDQRYIRVRLDRIVDQMEGGVGRRRRSPP